MLKTNTLLKNKLEQIEHQIEVYKQLLSSKFFSLRFPSSLEKDYRRRNDEAYIRSSRGVLFFGLLIYLVFGISDFALGLDKKGELLTMRITVTSILVMAFFIIINPKHTRWAVFVVTFGMIFIGLSIIVFMSLLEAPYSYAYHLGMIPWQVFILIALRTYTRAIFVCSITVFVTYVIYTLNTEYQLTGTVIDTLVLEFELMFVTFWGLLIIIGVYLGYFMEKFSRVDYVNNRLLALDAERLTLLSEELHVLSTTDSLTGLSNRRHLEKQLDSEWSRAQRASDSISLIMIDIDYFKKYNDFYGHQEGDDCLQQVSELLLQHVKRGGELVARYGGEEFMILLPRVELAEAQSIAEKIRIDVVSLNIPHADSDKGRVTISSGVAATVPVAGDGIDALIKAADSALYCAKDAGRDCVFVHSN